MNKNDSFDKFSFTKSKRKEKQKNKNKKTKNARPECQKARPNTKN